MRQWLVPPSILCRKHLLGEHVEHHMFIASIKKKKKIDGFIRKELVNPSTLYKRHDELVEEMLLRGYKHNSPLEQLDATEYPVTTMENSVNISKNLIELINRCPECKQRYEQIKDRIELILK